MQTPAKLTEHKHRSDSHVVSRPFAAIITAASKIARVDFVQVLQGSADIIAHCNGVESQFRAFSSPCVRTDSFSSSSRLGRT